MGGGVGGGGVCGGEESVGGGWGGGGSPSGSLPANLNLEIALCGHGRVGRLEVGLEQILPPAIVTLRKLQHHTPLITNLVNLPVCIITEYAAPEWFVTDDWLGAFDAEGEGRRWITWVELVDHVARAHLLADRHHHQGSVVVAVLKGEGTRAGSCAVSCVVNGAAAEECCATRRR